MAKWYGAIGYAVPTVIRPGVTEDVITEHMYYGDILKNNRRIQTTDQLNDNITLSHEISVVADPFAMSSIQYMRYVEIFGVAWEITNIEIQHPRLILSVGGVYNGKKPARTSSGT